MAAAAMCLAGVASAPAGAAPDACPNARFRVGASVTLPDCRAYEKITPAEKNGGAPRSGAPLEADGDHLYFTIGASLLPEDEGFIGGAPYLASRSPLGWTLRTASVSAQTATSSTQDFNAGFTQDIVQTTEALVPADDDPVFGDITGTDVYRRTVQGFDLVSTGSLAPNLPAHAAYAGQSADGSHILFETTEPLEPADAGRASGRQLYERVGNTTRVVGLDDEGTLVSPGGARLGNGAKRGVGTRAGSEDAVSEDGSRIFFQSPDPDVAPDSQLYLRETASTTTHVSASQCERVDPDPPCESGGGVTFQGAARDGSSVFFTTADQLTAGDRDSASDPGGDAGVDLYRYEVDSDELIRVSGGPADDEQNARVWGVTDVSDDGTRIYFAASGALAPGANPADAGEMNFYFHDVETGETKLVARLTTDFQFMVDYGLQNSSRQASATRDGSVLVFETADRLTAFDNHGTRQMYRYEAATGELVCVSCNSTGAPPITWLSTDSSAMYESIFSNPFAASVSMAEGSKPNSVVSDDGGSIAVATADALVPRDVNGRIDVYLWRQGELWLLTKGSSDRHARLFGISPDGDDVFISTYDRLVPADKDDIGDVYTVRVGGGLAADHPASPQPPCSGDPCQGAQSIVPPFDDPGSSELAGRGDVAAGPRAAFSVAGISRRPLARGRAGVVRVRVSRAGRVRVVARAKLRGRSRVVARGSAAARGAGTVAVRVRLSKAARRRLALGRSLRLSLSVRLSGIGEPRTTRLRLRQPTRLKPRGQK